MPLRRITRLGTGQLGETYLGRIEPDDLDVAVKELTRVLPREDAGLERHIAALGRLDHPALNKYHYLDTDGAVRRIVQDYFDADDLHAFLSRPPTRDEYDALQKRSESRPTSDDSTAPPTDPPTDESTDDSTDSSTDETTHESPNGTTDQATDQPHDAPNDKATSDQPSDTSPPTDQSTSPDTDPTTTTVPSERPTTGPLDAVDLDTDNFQDQFPDEVDPRARLDLLLYRLESILPQILAGLDYLHRFGHVHGDLRTSNILVDDDGQCRLVDYGLVTQLQPLGHSASSFNPRNTPPEVPEHRDLEPADDIYALGCLLFELITGLHPSRLRSDRELPLDELPDAASDELDPADCDLEDLSLLQPRCPAEWVDLILRMLDPDPRERPGLDRIQQVVERTEARSVDVPPSLVPEQQSFYGRSELLDDLTERASLCADREHLGLTLLSGAPGTGKSALAARAIHWAAEHGWLYLRGSCYPRESLILQGWDQIAARLADVCRRLGPELRQRLAPHRRRASRLFPVLRTTDESAPDCSRRTAVDGLRRLLRILSAERPILLVFDDLTWASWDTTALLGDLLGHPDDFPCFILGTWRPDSDTPKTERLEWMLESAPVDVGWLEMRNFTPHEAGAYVDSVGEQIPDDHRDLIVENGLDNPLLLQELVFQYHLELRGGPDDDLHRRSHPLVDALESEPDPAASPGDIDVPTADDFPDAPGLPHPPGEAHSNQSNSDVARRLRSLLDRRLDTLDRRQQFLVEILSVAALPLPEGLLSVILEEEFHDEQSGDRSVRSILQQLRKLRLVRGVDIHPWGDAFTLFHNVARTLVYRDLREQRYTHLCSRVADGLRQFWPQAKELRFEYLLRADRINESLDLAIRSARDASERFAYNRAAKLWRWITRHGDHSAQASSLRPERELALCERGAGRYEEAADLFRKIADALPNSPEQLRLRYREFRSRLHAGQRTDAARALDDGLSLVGDQYGSPTLLERFAELKNRFIAASSRWSDRVDATDTDELSTERRLQSQLYFDAVYFNDSLDSSCGGRFQAKLSAMAESTGHARLLGFDRVLLARQSHAHGQLRHPDRALDRYKTADALFSRVDSPNGAALVQLGRAQLARRRGHFDRAGDHLDRARNFCEPDQDNAHLLELDIQLERGRLHRDAGRLDDAISLADRIRHLYRFDTYARFHADALTIPILLTRGRIRAAHKRIQRCLPFADGSPHCWHDVWLTCQLARIHIARGQPEVAFVKLDVLTEDLDASNLDSVPAVQRRLDLSRAQALLARTSFSPRLGEPDAATSDREIKRIVARLTDQVAQLSPPLQSEIHRLAARWRLHQNRPHRALDSAESALAALRDYPSPLARGPALEVRARTLLATGDDDAAHSMYTAVHSVYHELDLQHPLTLEGWPVPSDLSRLKPDPAA